MTIVVGFDGSDASKEALRWAVAEARLRGTALRAVRAWEYPFIPPAVEPFPAGPMMEGGSAMDTSGLQENHEARLREAVAEIAGDPAGVEIELTVVEGHPAEVLVEAAEGAELLVVGSRGHGGITGMLLGSVSQAAVHHARSPVVIVRPPE